MTTTAKRIAIPASVHCGGNIYDPRDISAEWAAHVERIVVNLGSFASIQMTPETARELAEQLLTAIDAADGHWQLDPAGLLVVGRAKS